jgi:hypothetical protein
MPSVAPAPRADGGDGGVLDEVWPVARRDFLGLASLWAMSATMLIGLLGIARLPKATEREPWARPAWSWCAAAGP